MGGAFAFLWVWPHRGRATFTTIEAALPLPPWRFVRLDFVDFLKSGDFSLSKPVGMGVGSRPPFNGGRSSMVEPQIVILVVAGSSPVDHPTFPIGILVISGRGWRNQSHSTHAAAGKPDSL